MSPVAAHILQRAEERAAGQLTPGAVKTALVLQGGTLRAVASCGAAAALNHMGLNNAFDSVYGNSSGASNAAYFIAGQSQLGYAIYLEEARTQKFLNLRRFRKMMDLDYFFDEVIQGSKPLDVAAVRRHPTPLYALSTVRDTGASVWFSSKDDSVGLITALKASSAVPVIYGRGVAVGEERYVDGFINESLPILEVIEKDYTDVLVLLTRHISVRETEAKDWATRYVFEPLLRRELPAPAYARYADEWHRYNQAADIIAAGSYRRADGHTVRIAHICPDAEAEVAWYEKGLDRLIAAAHSTWQHTHTFFNQTEGASREAFEGFLSDP